MREEAGGMVEGGEGEIREEEVLKPSWGNKSMKLTMLSFPPPSIRRKILSEVPASTIGFMGDTSHIQLFVNQVNSTSKCSTPGHPLPQLASASGKYRCCLTHSAFVR